jgi:hypothetical protein
MKKAVITRGLSAHFQSETSKPRPPEGSSAAWRYLLTVQRRTNPPSDLHHHQFLLSTLISIIVLPAF